MPDEGGVTTGTGVMHYTLYNTDGSVASTKTETYGASDYTGEGDDVATAVDAHHTVAPSWNPFSGIHLPDVPSLPTLEAGLSGLLGPLVVPIALVLAGLFLFYFGPALGQLAKNAVPKKG